MPWLHLIYGGFLAVALSSAFTAAALYLVMRQRFLLWLVLRSVAIGVLVFAVMPLSLPIDADAQTRAVVGGMASAIAAACTGPYLADILESNIQLPVLRRRLWGILVLGLVIALIVPIGVLVPWMHTVQDLLFLMLVGALIYALVVAVRAGSRIARFQAVAWSGLLFLAVVSLVHELTMGFRLSWWVPVALALFIVEFVATAMGVVDGFMTIKEERDEAVAGREAAEQANATDPLTGIANRRGLERRFDENIGGRPTAVAILDCDAFKSINDTWGHQTGDKVLIAIAEGLRDEEDLFVARLGGEEFVVLLYTAGWQRRCERARVRVEQAVRDRMPDFERRVTASAGVTEVLPDDTLGDTLRRADRALYSAKREGRDQTFAAADRAVAEHFAYKVA